jgi:hypothetical protein
VAGVQLLAKAQECVSHIHVMNEWLLVPSSPLCNKCQGVFDKKLLLVDKGKVAKLDKTEIFSGRAVLLFIKKKTGVTPISRISSRPVIMHNIRTAQMYLAQAAALNSTSIKPVDASKLHRNGAPYLMMGTKIISVSFILFGLTLDAFGSIHHEKLHYTLKMNTSEGKCLFVCLFVFVYCHMVPL